MLYISPDSATCQSPEALETSRLLILPLAVFSGASSCSKLGREGPERAPSLRPFGRAPSSSVGAQLAWAAGSEPYPANSRQDLSIESAAGSGPGNVDNFSFLVGQRVSLTSLFFDLEDTGAWGRASRRETRELHRSITGVPIFPLLGLAHRNMQSACLSGDLITCDQNISHLKSTPLVDPSLSSSAAGGEISWTRYVNQN
jgi:hypothetical protein